MKLNPEILSGESLTKLPISRDNVPRSGSTAVTASDPEAERLTNQNRIRLPVLSPVPAQAHPPSPGTFDASLDNIPSTSNVGDQDQVEVTETVDGEPDAASLPARDPAVRDRDNSGAVFGHLEEHGHGEIEVRARRVAPPPIVAGLSEIRRAKVGGSDED